MSPLQKLNFAFGWSRGWERRRCRPNALVSAARPPCRVTRDGTRMHGGRLAIGGLWSASCRIWRGLRSRTRPAPTRAVSVRLLLGWTVGRSSAVACNGPASTCGCVVSCRGDQVRRCLCTVLDWIQICTCAGALEVSVCVVFSGPQDREPASKLVFLGKAADLKAYLESQELANRNGRGSDFAGANRCDTAPPDKAAGPTFPTPPQAGLTMVRAPRGTRISCTCRMPSRAPIVPLHGSLESKITS